MGFGGAIRVQVRRDNILKDSFVGLSNAGRKLKGRVQVEFISEQGLAEAGIDGGGLFKEYLDALTKSAFNPKSGLFKPTSSQLLTPNPQSLVVEDHLQYFNFIGKILGKALYEVSLLRSGTLEKLLIIFFVGYLVGTRIRWRISERVTRSFQSIR